MLAARDAARVDDGRAAGRAPRVEAVRVLVGALDGVDVERPRVARQRRLQRRVAVALAEADLGRVRWVAGERIGARRLGGADVAADRAGLRPPEARLAVAEAVDAAAQAEIAAGVRVAVAVVAGAGLHRRAAAPKLGKRAVDRVARRGDVEGAVARRESGQELAAAARGRGSGQRRGRRTVAGRRSCPPRASSLHQSSAALARRESWSGAATTACAAPAAQTGVPRTAAVGR